MLARFLGFLLLLVALPCGALAQSAPDHRRPASAPGAVTPPSSSAQRSVQTAAREQALAELDDADPLARIGALEGILRGDDGTLIDFALRKVLLGTDVQMKAVALRTLISNPRHPLVFTISDCRSTVGWSEQAMADTCRQKVNLLSGAVELHFDKLDPVSGQFMVKAPRSRQWMQGRLQGTTLSFFVDLAPYASQDCNGKLVLARDGGLNGELSCSGWFLSGRVDLF